MAQLLTLPQLLKQKVEQLKPDDFTKERIFDETEFRDLADVAESADAELDDRILAAKTLYTIAENRLIRAQRSTNRFKLQWQALQHQKEKDKELDSVLNKVKSVDGAEDLLERMLEMLRAKKESGR